MKIVADRNIPFIREAYSDDCTVVAVDGRGIDRKVLADADALLVRSVTPVTADLLSGSPVKFVASATIGVEHIDRVYLKKSGIGFAHAPGSNANSVVEYVIALILLMAEKLHRKPEDLVVGIIGVGNIGSLLRSRLKSLGMASLLNDPPKKLLGVPDRENYLSLDEVLKGSDIVTLHVPLETTGPYPTVRMVNDSFLERMKPGAVLINSCRGKTMIDESVKRYRKKLGGLVLDVWNNEPAIDPELCAMADFATPHIAGYSFDGKINGARAVYEAFCAFFKLPVRWNFGSVLDRNGPLIDCEASSDPVFDAITQTVPVLRDSAALKQIIGMSDADRSACFDSLRATYPERLECSHFSVRCGYNKTREAAILGDFGFTIVAT